MLWQLSKQRSLRGCGRGTRTEHVGVHLLEDGRATLTGLNSCSSVWSCSVCSAHIRQERANDIEKAAAIHLGNGGGVLFLTLTLRHHKGHKLKDLLEVLFDGWRRTIRGGSWSSDVDRFGIVGQIRSAEVTHGKSGWHPHLHILLFTDRALEADQVTELQDRLHGRWAAYAMEHGGRSMRPSRQRGSRMVVVTNGNVGQYLAKVQDMFGQTRGVGLEMARHDLKASRAIKVGGRLPFDILDDAADGEAESCRLWWEYEKATKGRRAITWSRGLRDLLGLDDERDDAAITDDTEVGEDTLVGTLNLTDWGAIVCAGLDSDLLDAVERWGADGIGRVLVIAYHRLE